MKTRSSLMIRCLVLGALAATLPACAPSGMGWNKAHTSDAERGADYDACSAEVRADTRTSRGIDADVLASRGADYQRVGQGASYAQGVTGSTSDMEARLLSACMEAKGYQHS